VAGLVCDKVPSTELWSISGRGSHLDQVMHYDEPRDLNMDVFRRRVALKLNEG